MSVTHDGDPAFPHSNDQVHYGTAGMTLRDYFAAKAMQGMLGWSGSHDPKAVSEGAYKYADAMIAQRGKVDPVLEAAPELLRACRGLLDVCSDYLTHEQQAKVAGYISEARAAIAKAGGGDR